MKLLSSEFLTAHAADCSSSLDGCNCKLSINCSLDMVLSIELYSFDYSVPVPQFLMNIYRMTIVVTVLLQSGNHTLR